MNILFLGSDSEYQRDMVEWLRYLGECVRCSNDEIKDNDDDCDFIVSYRYRYILEKKIVDRFVGRAINLHISYLPWNRGADPNLWSWIDGTPKGVTIHYIDEGIDTGDVLCQRIVKFNDNETLATSYKRLQEAMVVMFISVWPLVRLGNFPGEQQPNGGSYHNISDKNELLHYGLLTKGWHTPVLMLRK